MREHDTYRSERRNAWHDEYQVANRPWRAFNVDYYSRSGFSIPERLYPPSGPLLRGRSKYMPHQGKREMERRAEQLRLKAALLTRSTADEWRARHAA